jgi:kinesin family protein 6/9
MYRFAQRVALIKNKALINEEQDPGQVIKRLKTEVLTLREEMAYLKGENEDEGVLTEQDKETLREQCKQYCYDPDTTAVLNIGQLSLTKIKEAFFIMKSFLQDAMVSQKGMIRADDSAPSSNTGGGRSEESEKLSKQVRDLKALLLQRDSEITILVNMVSPYA